MRNTVLLVLAIAIVGAMGSPAYAGDDDDDFGDNVAGVWLGRFGNTPFIQTYSADGTAQTSTTTPTTSMHHVTWEKSGAREITWRLLHFNFNDQGLTFISRTTGVQTYESKFTEFSGVFTIEFCPCDDGPPPPGIDPEATYDCTAVLEALWADPNDPEVCTSLPFTFPLSGKRLDLDAPADPW